MAGAIPIVVGGFILVLGASITYQAYRDLHLAQRSRGWPTAMGRVVSLVVGGGATGDEVRTAPGAETDSFRIEKLTFTYNAGGTTYTADTITYSDYLVAREGGGMLRYLHGLARHLQTSAEAREMAILYPEGKEIRVYRHPLEHEAAILKPGPTSGVYLGLGLGVVVLLIGLRTVMGGIVRHLVMELSGDAMTMLIVTGCFLLFSLMVWRGGLRGRRTAESSRNWPTVRGKVTASNVEKGWKTLYVPRVFYKFSVGGVEYTSTMISFANDHIRKEAAEKTRDSYSVGKDVLVYYNPDNPEQAVLVPGRTRGGITGGLFLTIIALLFHIPVLLNVAFRITLYVLDR